MRKAVLFILISMAFISCKKEISGPLIEASVSLSLVNAKGDDLLNPNSSNVINEGNVDVYILRKGNKIRLYEGNLDAAKFFKIRNIGNKYALQLYFDLEDESFKDNKITQYITFKDGSEIEVVGEFNSDRGKNKILQKIWIDGVLKSKNEIANSGQNPIVIVK
ncbi:MAG: hypothetical protein EOO96_03450 [Pedobacter sp.]|nr:MAG: hypothetical protein EOO96_03450 [Pedobacter sp.]